MSDNLVKRYRMQGDYSDWWMAEVDGDGDGDGYDDASETEWVKANDHAAALVAKDAEIARLRGQMESQTGDTFYIDCEFDGHNGILLSIAVVRGDGRSLHVKIGYHNAVNDPWVRENVIPIMDNHHADLSWHVQPNEVGTPLRGFIGDCQNPTIIADSPVDIARFCRAISTGEDGGWHSSGYPSMTFIVRNVDCYPTTLSGAVQHNAWWDAMALRAALNTQHKGETP